MITDLLALGPSPSVHIFVPGDNGTTGGYYGYSPSWPTGSLSPSTYGGKQFTLLQQDSSGADAYQWTIKILTATNKSMWDRMEFYSSNILVGTLNSGDFSFTSDSSVGTWFGYTSLWGIAYGATYTVHIY